jgi:hypothetical protein
MPFASSKRKGGDAMLGLGILLVVVTIGVAVAIGYRANESVRRFDEEEHESFIGSKNNS